MANYIFKVNDEPIGKISRLSETISRIQGEPAEEGVDYERILSVYFDNSEDSDVLLAKAKQMFGEQNESSETPYALTVINSDTNEPVYTTKAYTYIRDGAVNLSGENGILETMFIFK